MVVTLVVVVPLLWCGSDGGGGGAGGGAGEGTSGWG